MSKPYFQPKPTTGNPYRAKKHYKSGQAIPLWAKLLTGGIMALVVVMGLLYAVPMKTQVYNAQVQAKSERIHAQIVEGKFRDVFLEGDRDLIKYNDEAEFTARLAAAQSFLAGNHKKTRSDFVYYEDLYNRFKDFIGRPALVASSYSLTNDTANAGESFYWMVRGDDLKLVDYRFARRNY